MEQWWLRNPEAPWWVKLRRARLHINEVGQRVDALQSAGMWSIQRDPANADGWTYRFSIHRAVPADLSAAVGDAVGNMRSSLDYVAYELARYRVAEMGREMSDEEEAATGFPICIDEETFERFFEQGRWSRFRRELYGDLERKALQCVQPFALTAEACEVGVELATDPQDELLTDHAYALNALWNIDKHRRLPELAWATENLVSVEGDSVVSRLSPLQDGTVLGGLHGPAGSERPQTDPNFEVHLVLRDDPSPYGSPLVARLERLHLSLTGWVIPRIFYAASGNPPPIMISFSPPT